MKNLNLLIIIIGLFITVIGCTDNYTFKEDFEVQNSEIVKFGNGDEKSNYQQYNKDNIRNSNDTIIKLNFPSFYRSDELFSINVTFTRKNGVLTAYENDLIDVSFIQYESNDNVLAISLSPKFTVNAPEVYEAREWIIVDIIHPNGYVETCLYYCDIVDGVAPNCCYENMGNCTGLGPFCGDAVV